ncbi:energy transducer TonB [Jeongeupia sp. USM3]|uniref:energy transducer TonB n=1 Tax=Jeongeupia sp. USM3 TaxID=1906741 RepID=UPI00089DF693|nr:energy transducer TonB [Jeongeupia sp. USM3]AOY01745.1 hypothetical protein BJP62_15540 [Jeongeupia sp. USM3]
MVLNNDFSWRASPVLVGVAGVHLLALYLVVSSFVATTPPQIIQPSLMFATLSEPAPEAAPQAAPQPQPKPRPVKPKSEPVKQQAKPAPKPVAKTTTSDKALHDSRPAEPEAAKAAEPAAPAVPAAPEKATAPAAAAAPVSETAPSFHANYLANPEPPYPPQSRALGEEGVVTLRVKVGENGLPISVEVAKSSGFPRLDAVARNTIKNRWKFVPAKKGNDAVVGTVLVPIEFKLNN